MLAAIRILDPPLKRELAGGLDVCQLPSATLHVLIVRSMVGVDLLARIFRSVRFSLASRGFKPHFRPSRLG